MASLKCTLILAFLASLSLAITISPSPSLSIPGQKPPPLSFPPTSQPTTQPPITLSTTANLPSPTICPTLTLTSASPSCFPFTSHCLAPLCIALSTLSVPCHCPTTIPTLTHYTACPTACRGECATVYTTQFGSCGTSLPTPPIYTIPPPISIPSGTGGGGGSKNTTLSTSTVTVPTITQPSTCKTITATAGPECWTAGCPFTYSRCNVESTVTLGCGCTTIPTATSCGTKTCDGGCFTNNRTAYSPRPLSMTRIGGPIGTLSAG